MRKRPQTSFETNNPFTLRVLYSGYGAYEAVFSYQEIGYNKRTYVSCKLDMKGLEDAIVEHIKQKSLNYKVKQFENRRLQAINSINHRLNK